MHVSRACSNIVSCFYHGDVCACIRVSILACRHLRAHSQHVNAHICSVHVHTLFLHCLCAYACTRVHIQAHIVGVHYTHPITGVHTNTLCTRIYTQRAVKVLDKRHIIKEKKVQHVSREKEILTLLKHPFFIKLYFTFQDKDHLCIPHTCSCIHWSPHSESSVQKLFLN